MLYARPREQGRLLRRCAPAALAVALACLIPVRLAEATAATRNTFAVIGSTLQDPDDEAPTRRLLDAIGREKQLSFVVYDGNLKGGSETCRDTLYEQRLQVLETLRVPLIFIPGEHDWVTCNQPRAGGYDALERLDFLRQTRLSDSISLGQDPIALTRESEVTRFRPYRENTRWQIGETVFIGLNVPGGNNHYLSAGGRNAEFEDRAVATSFWLEHAAEYAKRCNARALVVFIEGDTDLKQYERTERFAWLRFERTRPRDGYLEFKRSLIKLAQTFHGPVVLIHYEDRRLPGGFLIDQPLRNEKGARIANLTRIAIAPRERLTQWVQIDADFGRQTPFKVSIRTVPKTLPVLTAPRTVPREGTAAPPVPDASELLPTPPASALAPILQNDGQTAPPVSPAPSVPALPQ